MSLKLRKGNKLRVGYTKDGDPIFRKRKKEKVKHAGKVDTGEGVDKNGYCYRYSKHVRDMWAARDAANKRRREEGHYTEKRKKRVKGLKMAIGSNRSEAMNTFGGNRRWELPVKYEPGFIRDLDKRSNMYLRVKKNFDKIVNELGGEGEMSHIQFSLVEKVCFLMETMEQFESRMIVSEKKSVAILDKYVKGLNALQTICKMLGIKKHRAKGDLKSYLTGKKKDIA